MIAVESNQLQLIDKVVHISRVAKVVKGGRRFSFSAIVVVGDGNGKVGYSLERPTKSLKRYAKAWNRPSAAWSRSPSRTPRFRMRCSASSAHSSVILRPASAGTGVIAGGAVRAIMEAAGIHNILTKCVGSRNPHNVVKATVEGLEDFAAPSRSPASRGKNILEEA